MRFRMLTAVVAVNLALAGAMPAAHAQSSATNEPTAASTPATRSAPLKAFDARIAVTKEAMMGDPTVARRAAEEARAMAQAMANDGAISRTDAQISLATANWLLAEAMIGVNDADAARPLIDAALASVARANPRSKLQGDLLRSRATLSEMSGNVQGALKDYLQAHQIFRAAGEPRSQAIALQDIGSLYLEAGDFERVRDYYSQSFAAYGEDPWLNLATYNNRGESYRSEKRFAEATREYGLALASARKLESPLLEARILTNLADAQTEAGQLDQALRTIIVADALTRRGEAAGWRPFVYGVHALIEAKRGSLPAAGRYFQLAFAGERLDKTEMPFRQLHKAAAAVYESLGERELALAHLKAFQRLDSEALNLTASASSQLMAARFDFANLKQGQLERDIMIERQRTQFRTRLFVGLAAALLVIFGLLCFGYVSIRRSRDRVRAANAELSTTNVALTQALKARTDFLATTSHEIRTPLNGILGMTQVLLADRRLTGDMRERIQLLLGAGQTMKTLVDDILDVAKMEAGELTVDAHEVSLSRLLGETSRLWRESAANKGLALDCRLENVPDRILVDEGRLRQILSNLLSNAVKFTSVGGVTLDARTRDQDGVSLIEFAVRDTGIGIAADDQAMVFEAFTQVNNSTTREFSGTGLGLAISRRLALALGGDIALASTAGEGSCFTLTLPLHAVGEGLASIADEAGTNPRGLDEAALLFVDANAASHALLRMLLGPETRLIEIVGSADEATVRLAAEHFDHVVIEGASADLDGIRALVAEARQSGALTSLLAAPTEALGAAQLFAVGADQVILKPIGAADLIAALKKPWQATETAPAAAVSAAA